METRRNQIILKVMVVLPFYLFTFLPLSAQTFTQRIQQSKAGQGTVTIHQSPEIDQLVNNATLSALKPATPSAAQSPAATQNSASSTGTSGSPGTAATPVKPATTPTVTEGEAPVDNTKKIMKGYKVNGFRVQAFAGGNSRKDRLQAEQTGDKIKASFPEEPVYVHFYSPRWICRVGNYRTYEEAHQMLVSLRKLGFTQATIVKGKITVQY